MSGHLLAVEAKVNGEGRRTVPDAIGHFRSIVMRAGAVR
jgi:hypothetical protein